MMGSPYFKTTQPVKDLCPKFTKKEKKCLQLKNRKWRAKHCVGDAALPGGQLRDFLCLQPDGPESWKALVLGQIRDVAPLLSAHVS